VYLCEAFGGAAPQELSALFAVLAKGGQSVILVWTDDWPFPAEPNPNLLILDIAAPPSRQCGYFWDTKQLGPRQIDGWKSWSERTIFASFIGSRRTHRSRELFFNAPIAEQQKIVVKDVDWWSQRPATELYAFQRSARASFIETLQNSKFALCPRGNGPSSIRRWEAAYCGALPVLINDFTRPWNLDIPSIKFATDPALSFARNGEALLTVLDYAAMNGAALQGALRSCLVEKFDFPAISPDYTGTRHVVAIANRAWVPHKGFVNGS
jgi:hypothetical protein